MRILVLNWQDRANPRAGGAEIHLHEVFGRLADGGHRVVLVASGWGDAPPRLRADGMEIHRVGGRHTYGAVAPHYCRRTFDEDAFDVVVEDLNKVPLFAPLWAPWRLHLLVHHLFGTAAFEEAGLPVATATWLLERPIPWLYRGVPTVAVSESTRADLVERGLRRREIEVIPNGVDVESLRPAADGEGRYDEPTILYLGRLQRYKRVDLPLRAVARLREDGLPVRFLIAGKGRHRSALEAERDRLGLDDAARFLGYVSEEEKAELLRRSWVHVLTSPKEGWGIANLEAAAAGTPTVASDSPGLRDSVRHGETGFLVPHGDVDALAGKIRTLVEAPELRERLGAAGRAFAEEHTWSRVSRRYESYLRERVAADSGPA